MKKKFCLLLLGLCLISMSACENNSHDIEANNIASSENDPALHEDNLDGKIAQKDDTGNNTIEVSNSENGLVVVPGTYDIGDYIGNTNYLITCEETDYSMQVIVFENKETYDNYKNTKRITNGEELAAIEQNALYDYYLEQGETGYLSLDDDYVLLIDSGNGRLKEFSGLEINNTDLYCGVYFVGNDIKSSRYLLTCTETEYSMQALVFENMETYKAYHQTSRFTNGEELAAIEQNALYDYYLEQGETGYLSLDDDYVLLIDSGNGRLKEFSGLEINNTDLYCGVYFVGNDIKSSRYLLTCTETEYSMQVLVFENMETYKAYHQTSRFTNGEELAAIEQNALYDCYLDAEETGYLNLADGYIVLINGGSGNLSEIDMNSIDNSTAWYSDENIGLCNGIYFVGNDLDAAQYSLTCTDSYMQAIVFENFDMYKAYHQSSRFTGGEESEAIEKNALLSKYVYEDNSIALNLKEENILLINGGIGSLEMLSK